MRGLAIASPKGGRGGVRQFRPARGTGQSGAEPIGCWMFPTCWMFISGVHSPLFETRKNTARPCRDPRDSRTKYFQFAPKNTHFTPIPSFRNSISERTWERNSIANGGGVCGQVRPRYQTRPSPPVRLASSDLPSSLVKSSPSSKRRPNLSPTSATIPTFMFAWPLPSTPYLSLSKATAELLAGA